METQPPIRYLDIRKVIQVAIRELSNDLEDRRLDCLLVNPEDLRDLIRHESGFGFRSIGQPEPDDSARSGIKYMGVSLEPAAWVRQGQVLQVMRPRLALLPSERGGATY